MKNRFNLITPGELNQWHNHLSSKFGVTATQLKQWPTMYWSSLIQRLCSSEDTTRPAISSHRWPH